MKKLIPAALLSFATIANAAPSQVYDGKVVSNNTNSPILRDNKDASRLYVLPPTQGKISSQTNNLFVTRPQCENLAEITADITESTRQIRTLKNKVAKIAEAIESDDGSNTERLAKAQANMISMKALIKDHENDIDAAMLKYGNRAGGYVHMEFRTPWSENRNSIQANNSNFPNVQTLGGNNLLINMSIPGLAQEGQALPIYTDFAVNGINSKSLGSQSTQAMSDENMTVDLSLTQWGACYLRFPSLFGADNQAVFGMTATYDVPQSFAFNITAKYNLWSIYKYFHEQGSSSSMFSSSSYSRTIEQSWGESAFSIDWVSEDPEAKISTADRIKISNEIKSQLLADLATLISQKLNKEIPVAPAVGKNGAQVIGDELQKYPDPRAQVAAMVFKALDAMFGSSSSTVSYEKTLNVTATHKFNSDEVRYVKRSTIYTE